MRYSPATASKKWRQLIPSLQLLKQVKECYFLSDFLPWIFRSSRPAVFYKKGVLNNFAKFTGKHLCQSLFFIKLADLWLATLLKKGLWHMRCPVNFAKFLRTLFLTEHLRWLLLNSEIIFFLTTMKDFLDDINLPLFILFGILKILILFLPHCVQFFGISITLKICMEWYP